MKHGDEVTPATISQFTRAGVTWVSEPKTILRGDVSDVGKNRIISVRSPEPHPNIIGVQLSVLNREDDTSVPSDNFGAVAVAEWGFDRGKCRATFDIINGVAANFLCSNLNISAFLGVDKEEESLFPPPIIPVSSTVISGTVAWGGIQGHPRPQRTIQLGTIVWTGPPAPAPVITVPIPNFARNLDVLRVPISSGYRIEFVSLNGPVAPIPVVISQHDVAAGADLPRLLTIPKRATQVNFIPLTPGPGPGFISFSAVNLVFGLDL